MNRLRWEVGFEKSRVLAVGVDNGVEGKMQMLEASEVRETSVLAHLGGLGGQHVFRLRLHSLFMLLAELFSSWT